MKHRIAGWRGALVVCLLLAGGAAAGAAKGKTAPPQYAHWLNEEVTYLITSEERDQFLDLNTDQERDHFIDIFWEARNPNLHSPENVFKGEHYRRLAYVNDHYGTPGMQDGWRSDRGRVYITLGPPQQLQAYPETKHLLPMEIWFYENTSTAIPPHFSVLFYRRSPAEPYRMYSPYGDRPQKLVNSTDVVNDDARAIKIIDSDLGPEVAHVALSLIPGEPVDLKEPSPSLQSDVLLNDIREFRNLPVNKQLISLRRSQLEGVTHRILLGEEFSRLALVATRDSKDAISLHYLLRFEHPGDMGLAEQGGDRYYYSLEVDAELMGPDGVAIYRDVERLSNYVSKQQYLIDKNKCFGVEGRLPAAPGKYELHVALTNLLSKQTFRQSRVILVPDFDHPLALSQVFFAAHAAPERDPSLHMPFSFAGVRLAPIGGDNAILRQGDPLRLIMQVWEAPASPEANRGTTLDVAYLIGQLGSAEKQEEHQVIDRGSFDASGNLLIGHDLRTDTLIPGNYRLVIKASNPGTGAAAYQSLNFEVQDIAKAPPSMWTAIVPSFGAPGNEATNLYRGGLCALANRHADLAVRNFLRGLELDGGDAKLYRGLTAAYRMQGNLDAVAATERKLTEMQRQPPLKRP